MNLTIDEQLQIAKDEYLLSLNDMEQELSSLIKSKIDSEYDNLVFGFGMWSCSIGFFGIFSSITALYNGWTDNDATVKFVYSEHITHPTNAQQAEVLKILQHINNNPSGEFVTAIKTCMDKLNILHKNIQSLECTTSAAHRHNEVIALREHKRTFESYIFVGAVFRHDNHIIQITKVTDKTVVYKSTFDGDINSTNKLSTRKNNLFYEKFKQYKYQNNG